MGGCLNTGVLELTHPFDTLTHIHTLMSPLLCPTAATRRARGVSTIASPSSLPLWLRPFSPSLLLPVECISFPAASSIFRRHDNLSPASASEEHCAQLLGSRNQGSVHELCRCPPGRTVSVRVSLRILRRFARPRPTTPGAHRPLSCRRSLTSPLTWWRLPRWWAWCGNASTTVARTGGTSTRCSACLWCPRWLFHLRTNTSFKLDWLEKSRWTLLFFCECVKHWLLRSSFLPQALTLLDYLLKTGSERVAQQCCENAFTIQVAHFPKHSASRLLWGPVQCSWAPFSSFSPHLSPQTLRDFQYVDRDGRDQGANVREKARQLVCLLRDEDRLHQERSQALKTKERMAGGSCSRGGGGGGSGGGDGGGSVYGGIPPSYHPGRRTSQPSMAVLYGEEFSRSRGSPSSFNCEF